MITSLSLRVPKRQGHPMPCGPDEDLQGQSGGRGSERKMWSREPFLGFLREGTGEAGLWGALKAKMSAPHPEMIRTGMVAQGIRASERR